MSLDFSKNRPHDPAKRGYVPQYRGAETECPGCGRSNWYRGRFYAECAFCGVAIGLGGEQWKSR